MRQEIECHGITYQLTPAGNHCHHTAERAFQTFKTISYQAYIWYTNYFPWTYGTNSSLRRSLNLFRPSLLNPRLYDHPQLYGIYNYFFKPIAPPVMRVIAHDLPTQRRSWAAHASQGFYLGPALHHYRCFRIWNTKTQSKRISQTIKRLPYITIPTPDELLRSSIHDIVQTLK